jgi:uncharacterized protein YigE (DUF2233 family)
LTYRASSLKIFFMRKVGLLLLGLMFFSSVGALAQGVNPPPPPMLWKSLAPGLSFSRWPVQSGGQILDTLAILKIQPDLWTFRVFFNRTPKSIEDWRKSLGAPIVINGGFYQENFNPAGKIVVDGNSFGPLRNPAMKGMFLSEPKKGLDQLPRATIIDLKEPRSEETIGQYDQGIQSFPILLDPRGQVRVNASNFQANRTVVALDRQGNILILITEKPYFTLYALGQYLKKMPLSLSFALNLDGGNRTQLAVQVNGFNYKHTGQEGTPEATRLFFPEGTAKLPSVIGIFPRGRAS